MLPVAVPQHYELQTCAAFGFPARFSNSSDAAYLRSPLFVRALMTSLRTAITDGLLRPIVSRACAHAVISGHAVATLCSAGFIAPQLGLALPLIRVRRYRPDNMRGGAGWTTLG